MAPLQWLLVVRAEQCGPLLIVIFALLCRVMQGSIGRGVPGLDLLVIDGKVRHDSSPTGRQVLLEDYETAHKKSRLSDLCPEGAHPTFVRDAQLHWYQQTRPRPRR